MVEPQLPQLRLTYNDKDEADQSQMLLIIIMGLRWAALPLKTMPAIITAISVTLGCTFHKSRHALSHYSTI